MSPALHSSQTKNGLDLTTYRVGKLVVCVLYGQPATDVAANAWLYFDTYLPAPASSTAASGHVWFQSLVARTDPLCTYNARVEGSGRCGVIPRSRPLATAMTVYDTFVYLAK